MIGYVATFVAVVAVVAPIGTVPVFIAATKDVDGAQRRRAAMMATFVAAAILLFFVIAGEPILTAMSIPLAAFQIAGGVVLFLFTLSMVFGESKPDEEVKLTAFHAQTAIFPLAAPLIASPNAVLMTENARYNIRQQAQTAIVMLSVLLVAFVLMLASVPITAWSGSRALV